MPPQRAIFRHTASAAPAPAAPGSAARLVDRDRHRRLRAHLAQRLEPVDRLLAQLEADRGERAQVGERLARRAPGAVGVGADRHVRADRGAHGGEPAGVVADPDLDLHAAEARRRRRAAASAAAPARSAAPTSALTGTEARRRARPAAPPPAARPGAPRGPTARGRSPPAPAGAAARRGRRPAARRRSSSGPASREHRGVGVERGEHRRHRHAVVGLQRRRLAHARVAGAEAQPHACQLALAPACPTPSRAASAAAAGPARRAASPSLRRRAGPRRAACRTRAGASPCGRARR